MGKRRARKRPGRRGPPDYRRMSIWLSEDMSLRLVTHAANQRADTGAVVEAALKIYLAGSHYEDRSRGSVGSAGPAGPEPAAAPPPARPELHVANPETGEGDGSAAA